jgi:hypothetical protein
MCRILGFKAKCQHGANIPGYWPEENNQLGLLAYHSRYNASCAPSGILHYDRVGSRILETQVFIPFAPSKTEPYMLNITAEQESGNY